MVLACDASERGAMGTCPCRFYRSIPKETLVYFGRCIFQMDLGGSRVPRQLVSDNGTIQKENQRSSENFANLMGPCIFAQQDIIQKSIRTTTYHPKPNGIAERFVRTFKQQFLASQGDAGD
ncbi:hypothetical protein J437_LFUL019208 [Ladona fulva]|uniref:Uncharacterized protein n=1 Tax=Ladona fulva TaxID=123851 RepID=A0A8K0KRM2_LADFU|nr:hypothetical protein J437_LFUL019208 [Ladona fulva]